MTERPPSPSSPELPPEWQEQLKRLERAAREFREQLANEITERILTQAVQGFLKTPQRMWFSVSFPTWVAYVEEILQRHYSSIERLFSTWQERGTQQNEALSPQVATGYYRMPDALLQLRWILLGMQHKLKKELGSPNSLAEREFSAPRELRALIAQTLVPPIPNTVRDAPQEGLGQHLRNKLLASLEKAHPSVVEAVFRSDAFRRSTFPFVLLHVGGVLRKMDSQAQQEALRRFEAEHKRHPLKDSVRDQLLLNLYHLQALLEHLPLPSGNSTSREPTADGNQ